MFLSTNSSLRDPRDGKVYSTPHPKFGRGLTGDALLATRRHAATHGQTCLTRQGSHSNLNGVLLCRVSQLQESNG